MTAAIRRLMKELLVLEDHPLIRGNAAPVGDDLYNWKLLVVGQKPYDFPIRIHLEFPKDYPNSAPKAFFETTVKYTGGATIRDDKGRQVVCLNIFGNFAHVHTEWKTQEATGWTPGYGVETIILSIQALMMSDMLSTSESDIAEMRASALSYKCQETEHDGSDPSKYRPQVILEQQFAASASSATEKGPLEESQYICYVNKALPADKLLGYGIEISGGQVKFFSSPCELMGHDAFLAGIRQSSMNKPFSHWLPIITPHRPWSSIEGLFNASSRQIVESIGEQFDGARSPLKICLGLMNSLVVEIMNAANNLTANDKFIDGYFMFYRVLMEHVRAHPVVAEKVEKLITSFTSSAQNRSKAKVPNLGEFILYPLCTAKFGWKDISKAFIAECDARCVFWYIQGTRNQPGACLDLKDPSVKPRAQRVFDATATSRNLVCYQKQFLTFAKGLSLQEIDANRGFVPESIKKEIKDFYKKITGMKTWAEYFLWLEMPLPASMDTELLEALATSSKSGYHR